jgi:hypothetical protein
VNKNGFYEFKSGKKQIAIPEEKKKMCRNKFFLFIFPPGEWNGAEIKPLT